jgi:predicted phosphodiesterase
MPPGVRHPELFGVTESGFTLFFSVEDAAGPVAAEARVRVEGVVCATTGGGGDARCVRIEGLEPDTEYELAIEVEGAGAARPDEWLPERVRTLPAPRAAEVACFATLNDLHFGEPRFGGVLMDDGETAERAGHPVVRAEDTEVPYWRFMNEDAIDEINREGVDFSVIKGDIADRGLPEQFEAARRAFSGFAAPHHAFLGNHDYYGLHQGLEVDGYALLGQPAAPRALDAGGWRLVLLETVEPGEHHGVFGDARLRWLEDALCEARETGTPTLLLAHHHPVPPEFADRFPNDIAIRPEHSLALFDLVGRHPEVKGVLLGHTHRNRVRRHKAAGRTPFVEVQCTKDYPGGWAHYRLFEDGSFRQEVRRTASERALAHSTRCRDLFGGGYRRFSLGRLEERSFAVETGA